MARPRKDKSAVRCNRVTVRFSDRELVALFAKVDRLKLSPAELLRRAALGQKVPPSIPDINVQTYVELGRIGNNLNQFLKSFHLGQVTTPPAGLVEELAELIRRARREVRGQ